MGGRLDGKVVVVTGAASRGEGVGTGKAIALLSAREGAKVVLVNRSAERAEGLAEEIRAEGGEAFVFAGDATEEADATAMAEAAEAHFGCIDALVNNVGGSRQQGAVMEIGREGWDATIAVNLTSAMLCSRACIPAMQRGGGGSILNISSVVGARGLLSSTGSVAYASAKAGLHGFTMSLATDYAKDAIRSNCIIVGTIYTPMVAHQGPEARARRAAMVPLGTEGTGWDIGWAAVYLTSDEARWITGLLLPVDAGLLAIRDWPR